MILPILRLTDAYRKQNKKHKITWYKEAFSDMAANMTLTGTIHGSKLSGSFRESKRSCNKEIYLAQIMYFFFCSISFVRFFFFFWLLNPQYPRRSLRFELMTFDL